MCVPLLGACLCVPLLGASAGCLLGHMVSACGHPILKHACVHVLWRPPQLQEVGRLTRQRMCAWGLGDPAQAVRVCFWVEPRPSRCGQGRSPRIAHMHAAGRQPVPDWCFTRVWTGEGADDRPLLKRLNLLRLAWPVGPSHTRVTMQGLLSAVFEEWRVMGAQRRARALGDQLSGMQVGVRGARAASTLCRGAPLVSHTRA